MPLKSTRRAHFLPGVPSFFDIESVIFSGEKVGRFSTDDAGTLVFSGPVSATRKEREYMQRADENSLALARNAGWGKWKPSNKSPQSLTPNHRQQWIPPPCSDMKPWRSRKPPSAYRTEVLLLFTPSAIFCDSRRCTIIPCQSCKEACGYLLSGVSLYSLSVPGCCWKQPRV